MEHLQTIPSTMADRERSYGMEKERRNSDQFGSQRSLSNLSQPLTLGSQQYSTSDTESNQRNIITQGNGHKLMAGIRSSSGQLVPSNKFEPSKRIMG